MNDAYAPRRVLVIDDDIALRDMLVEALNFRGYMATGLSDSSKAEEMVLLWGAQVVLCDICMPGVNGLDLARRLKEQDPGTQVLLMTGLPNQETIDEAYDLGADSYLIKPFRNMQAVFDAIEKATHNIRTWHLTSRDSLKAEFPEEYRIIYDTPTTLDDYKEVDALIQKTTLDIPKN